MRPAGTALAEAGDQPVLPADGDAGPCNLYHAWVTQRAQNYYASLSAEDQRGCAGFLEASGLAGLVKVTPPRLISRIDNRLCLAEPA